MMNDDNEAMNDDNEAMIDLEPHAHLTHEDVMKIYDAMTDEQKFAVNYILQLSINEAEISEIRMAAQTLENIRG